MIPMTWEKATVDLFWSAIINQYSGKPTTKVTCPNGLHQRAIHEAPTFHTLKLLQFWWQAGPVIRDIVTKAGSKLAESRARGAAGVS